MEVGVSAVLFPCVESIDPSCCETFELFVCMSYEEAMNDSGAEVTGADPESVARPNPVASHVLLHSVLGQHAETGEAWEAAGLHVRNLRAL